MVNISKNALDLMITNCSNRKSAFFNGLNYKSFLYFKEKSTYFQGLNRSNQMQIFIFLPSAIYRYAEGKKMRKT